MHTELFNQLELLVVIFVLISLSAYVFFAYYEFKFDTSENVRFIDNILAFSILWTFECLLIVFYFLSSKIQHGTQLMSIINLAAFCIAFLLIVVALDFYKKRRKKLKLIPLFPVSVCASLLLLAALFHTSTFLILNIALAAFLTLSLLLALRTIGNNKKTTRTGSLYVFCGILLIAIVNLFKNTWDYEFIIILNLALALFLILGFFVYYSESYSAKIHEKMQSIQIKNKELIIAEKKISTLAYVDQITGLKNIYQFQEDIQKCLYAHRYSLIINLKNFKIYNQIAAYEKGNKVLLSVADKLKGILNPQDEIYHYYSDKFILLHPGDRNSTEQLVYSILDLFCNHNFCTVQLIPYIGIANASDPNKTFDCLLQELELASQHVKNENLEYAFYDERWYQEYTNKLRLEISLRKAVENKDWEIYFQPKLSLTTNDLIGAEALIRWKNTNTPISPQVFIPLAEQLGLIQDIGKYVIETTFAYVEKMNAKISKNLNISINLSPYQLMDKQFGKYITELVKAQKVNPQQITFEITESALMDNLNNVNDTIQVLKRLGFHFSLDDFGTGYSSLNYFSRLNLDEIKFDRGFTNSLPKDKKNLIILENLTRMAKKLGIHIVIEGVETKEQYECIKEFGCDTYQGYYFSRPIPYEEFLSLIQTSKP